MRANLASTVLSPLMACCMLFCSGALLRTASYVDANEEPSAEQAVVTAVDDDMHHFMEYVFEPNYKRLKKAMADRPGQKQVWKQIKGDALTLAECANLLMLRAPEENPGEWKKLSVAVREQGGWLYQAARKADYSQARVAYTGMLQRCNTCHQKFADGEHQLEP